MNKLRFAVLALAVSAATATLLPAQQGTGAPPRPPAGGRGGRGAAGGGAGGATQPRMAGGPRGGGAAGMILGRGAQLNLTDDQVKKLQALQAAPNAAEPSQTTMMRLQADLMDATKGEGNLEAARTALNKISSARTDATIARMKSRKDARDVLTAAQKLQLDQMERRARMGMRMRGMQGGRGGMQRGGMQRRMGGPGMRGGMRGGMGGNRMGFGGGMRGPQQMRGQQFRGPQMRGNQMGPGMMPRMRRGGMNDDGAGMDANIGPQMMRQNMGPGFGGGMMGPGQPGMRGNRPPRGNDGQDTTGQNNSPPQAPAPVRRPPTDSVQKNTP